MKCYTIATTKYPLRLSWRRLCQDLLVMHTQADISHALILYNDYQSVITHTNSAQNITASDDALNAASNSMTVGILDRLNALTRRVALHSSIHTCAVWGVNNHE